MNNLQESIEEKQNQGVPAEDIADELHKLNECYEDQIIKLFYHWRYSLSFLLDFMAININANNV